MDWLLMSTKWWLMVRCELAQLTSHQFWTINVIFFMMFLHILKIPGNKHALLTLEVNMDIAMKLFDMYLNVLLSIEGARAQVTFLQFYIDLFMIVSMCAFSITSWWVENMHFLHVCLLALSLWFSPIWKSNEVTSSASNSQKWHLSSNLTQLWTEYQWRLSTFWDWKEYIQRPHLNLLLLQWTFSLCFFNMFGYELE